MYSEFLKKMNTVISLNEEEQKFITDRLGFKKIRRRQYLLQSGDVCKNIFFVRKGTLRAYSVSDNGAEHIIQFAIEGWLISDQYSFIANEPSIYNIDALEDTEVIMISQSARASMLEQIPGFEAYVRKELTNAYSAMQKRITSLISLSPTQRYNCYIEQYPHMMQRVPLRMIASYLGMNAETLSRIRKKGLK